MVDVDDALWRWRSVSESAVRSDGVVVVPPLLDQDLSFPERIEDFSVEEFISKPGVEALAVSVLPRRTRLDSGCLRFDSQDPGSHLLGDELRAVI